ncbi:MAG: hypothetical protein OHK0022_19210 [Roseiflexaceae bacterium]
MDYYISWTHSDPIYQSHLAGVRALVSPPNVSLSWNVAKWSTLPEALILDSGAFQYWRSGKMPEPTAVLARQLSMIEGTTLSVGLCHLDVPLLGARSQGDRDERVAQNLRNAHWLIGQVNRLPARIRPIGVIQGFSVENVCHVALTLADMGYTAFALGSLAKMVASSRDEVLRRVEAALEAVGPNIHVLGVSSTAVLAELGRLGIASADSGAPIHEGWRGGLFYSRPFRRYKIASAHFQEWGRSYSFADVLDAPLSCSCPVCASDSARLMEPRGKEMVNLRALHNCYHLMRELDPSRP